MHTKEEGVMTSTDWNKYITPLYEPAEPHNWLDKFVGPGATSAECILQFGIAIVAAIAAVVYPLVTGISWGWWQYIIAGFLGLDMVGGVATNATNSGKSWYHRRSQTTVKHLSFIAIHILQIALVYGFFAPSLWPQGLVLYLLLLVFSTAILLTPLYLQRPVALLCYVVTLIINIYGITQIRGLEWFVPVFFLKLLASHLPFEICFRPLNKN
jgi:hypothetical protein